MEGGLIEKQGGMEELRNGEIENGKINLLFLIGLFPVSRTQTLQKRGRERERAREKR